MPQCQNCHLSFSTLKQMCANGTAFTTAGGNHSLLIFEANDLTHNIIMQRENGNLTPPITFETIQEIHRQIEQGNVDMDPRSIDIVAFRWGNYITGLLKHLGCFR